jgi:ribosome-associated protein
MPSGRFVSLNLLKSFPDHQPTVSSEPAWPVAVRAAEAKKAQDIKVLDLSGVSSFTDYFVICTGSNPKQIQAIADEVEKELKLIGERPLSIEGYQQAEWILADYGDFIIHIFSERARLFYDLERLWRAARAVPLAGEPAAAV